ncbi:MAG: 2-hydroxyacyl-CoA dehydratase family protein [Eubacteriales bacterium]|nr:2-hydroxyacyl-CoA dehydratase family protein [Eubacteriales bacterium]
MSRLQELLVQFEEIANSPRKQLDQYLAQGKQAIGVVPVYTPEEILHSMGYVPFGMWGADIEVRDAKAYYPSFICSILQSILELGIHGAYRGLKAIVIPSLCDSLKSLGQNWKYAVEDDILFIPMTYPQNRANEVGRAFTKASYERVIEDIEKHIGGKFDDNALQKSLDIYNEHNRLMRELSLKLSEHDQITAYQRRNIFKSAHFMLKEEHSELVKEFLSELKALEKSTKKVRVITTGILADSPNLLAIFDDNNMTIVGDDIAHESRQYRTDSLNGDTALEKLVDKFANMGCCSVLYDKDRKRADMLRDMAKERNADGVIVLMTKFCDPEEFDYVCIKNTLDDANIANVITEIDRQMVNYEQTKTTLETFKEMIR